jgi:hypothetical protein
MSFLIETLKERMTTQRGAKPSGKLYMSAIGHKCARKIWYDFNEPQESTFNFKSIAAMKDGEDGEQRFIFRANEYLKDQVKLSDFQKRIELFDGKLSGKIDGIAHIYNVGEYAVWEHKEVAEKKFKTFKGSLLSWDEGYYAQAQIYMDCLNINKHWLTIGLAGGRDYEDCFTVYNPQYVSVLKERLDMIIHSRNELPRINDNPSYFICKMCEYSEKCHATKTVPAKSCEDNPRPFDIF